MRQNLKVVAVASLMLLSTLALIITPLKATVNAGADTLQQSSDSSNTGWYPNEPELSPSSVTSGDFGQLFDTQLVGQIYAQPLVSQSVVLAATEENNVYGLDASTGAIDWQDSFGAPADPLAQTSCGDIGSAMGITGTPVIDPSTHVAYFVTATDTGLSGATQFFMHAVNVADGTTPSNWPSGGVPIQGSADDDPGTIFDGQVETQRPGLVLVNGVVYAGFSAQCDLGDWTGWLVGVSTSSAAITTMWATETGIDAPNGGGGGAGIWESGSAPVVDSQGNIYVATGNGNLPAPGAGTESPEPNNFGESVIKLSTTSGTLQVVDWFTPSDAAYLNSVDGDLGSGGPVALPASMGTPSEPNVMVEIGKEGILYGLNMDSLGGYQHGINQSDAIPSESGSYGGVWSAPAVWPGNGGYIYIVSTGSSPFAQGTGSLNVYQRQVSASGAVYFQLVGSSSKSGITFPFGSGHPIVTSDATTSGSSIVWITQRSGASSNLVAFDPIPQNPGAQGSLQEIWSAPIGTSTKFSEPVADDGKIYVGTQDGDLIGFGLLASSAPQLQANNVVFSPSIVSQPQSATAQFTAMQTTTITSFSQTGSSFSMGTPSASLPAVLSPGDSISVPLTFTPNALGALSGTLTANDTGGTTSITLEGEGLPASATVSASPSEVDFGTQPIGGATVSEPVTLTNNTANVIQITGFDAPALPFSVADPPANGSLEPGGAITFSVSFDPPGSSGNYEHVFGDVATLETSVGPIGVPVSGSANPPAQINITPTTLEFGNVEVGASQSLGFQINNQGSLPLAIIETVPPASNGFSTPSSLNTSTIIGPNSSIFEQVQFAPQSAGTFVGSWLIEGDDGSGVQTVTLTGTGISNAPLSSSSSGGRGGGGGGASGGGVSSGGVATTTASLVASPPPNYSGFKSTNFGTPSSVTTSSTTFSFVAGATGAQNEKLTVPPGALPSGTVVSLYPVVKTPSISTFLPATDAYLLSFAITWRAPDGTSPSANIPMVVSIKDPSIKAGDKIYELTSSGLVVLGTALEDGSVTVTFSNDPIFIAAKANLATNAPVVIHFTSKNWFLSSQAKKTLQTLAKATLSGNSITVTGYALNDAPLALRRATSVRNYLLTLRTFRVTLRSVTSSSSNFAIVTTMN